MKKNVIKIISIIFVILFISITPLSGYIIGCNNKVYAAEVIATNAFAKFVIPIAALFSYEIMESKGIVDETKSKMENVVEIIEDMNKFKNAYWGLQTARVKATIYKMYTDLSNYEINKLLNTTFSASEFTHIQNEINDINFKIQNGEELSVQNLQGIGVYKLLAHYLGTNIEDFDIDIQKESIQVEGSSYYHYDIGTDKWLRLSVYQGFNSKFFELIGGNLIIKDNGYSSLTYDSGTDYFRHYLDYRLQLSNDYYLKIPSGDSYIRISTNNSGTGGIYSRKVTITDQSQLGLTRCSFGIYNNNDELVVNNTTIKNLRSFISFIQPYSANNLIDSDFYINAENYNFIRTIGIMLVGNITYLTAGFYAGDYALPGIYSEALDPDAGAIPDTNIDAERVIAQESATTSDTNISVEEDEEKGPTIIVLPDGGVAETSDVNVGENVGEDPEGIFEPDSDGWIFRIPILGTILKILRDILNALRDWFTRNPTVEQGTSGEPPGVDWGNFKNFFDIFWIFYYLIIIAILLLVKFLAVVMDILSIPANTALFDSYPALLQGLNYIKGLKVGGFNITLQQIFEYMFMVFFFIYIVTTLQKLYHVFTGVERQELRHNQRDIQIDKTSFSNEVQSNDLNNLMNGGNKK